MFGKGSELSGSAVNRLLEAEIAIRRVRWFALGFVFIQFGVYTPPEGTELPFARWPVAAFVFAVLLAANLASLRLTPGATDRTLRRLGAATTAVDTLLVLLIVVLFGFDETTRIWPLLTFPIVEGALRGGSKGALATWGLGAGGFVLDQIIRLGSREDPASWVGSMTFAAAILLFVALGTGFLANRLQEVSDRAVVRSERLRRLAELARRMSQERSATAVYAGIVDSAIELTDFEASSFYEHLGNDLWKRHASDGTRVSGPAVEAEVLPPFTRIVTALDGPAQIEITPALQERIDQVAPGVRTIVAVPVRHGDEVLGLLLVGTSRVEVVDPELLDILRVLAADAAAAIRNAHLAEGELRQIERLQALDAAKDEFVAVLTHELRTPMTSIVGFADLLRNQWHRLDDEKRATFLDSIRSGVRKLSDLIGDILDATSAQQTELPVRPRRIDLVETLRPVVERELQTAPNHDLVLRTPERLAALADPERVGQIVQNLVNNAIKYSPDGGTVTITLGGISDEEVAFSIEDVGLGIPEASLPLVFGKFNRFHAAHGIKGTGLGLYLVRSLVEAMHGRIEVDSEEGVGSLFTVILPSGEGEDLPAN